MNYKQLKLDAHTLYIHGHLSQKMAVEIMGLQPSKRWIVTQCHKGVQWMVNSLMKDLEKLDESKK